MKKAVIGAVDSRLHAEVLVRELERVGFWPAEISVLLPDTGASRTSELERRSSPREDSASARVAGILGAGLRVLVGAGALVIPGVGPVIAAGPIRVGLGARAAGETGGGVTEAGVTDTLVSMGVSSLEAQTCETRLGAAPFRRENSQHRRSLDAS